MSSHASDAPPVDGVNVNNSGIFGAPAGPRVGDRFVAPGAGAKRVQMAQSGLKSFFPGASAETTNTEAELVGAPGRNGPKRAKRGMRRKAQFSTTSSYWDDPGCS